MSGVNREGWLEHVSRRPTRLKMSLRSVQILVAAFLVACAAGNSQTMSLPSPNSATQTTKQTWPAVEGTVVLSDFRFGTGETLPELKLHYLTLGTPHRNS